MAFKQQPLVQSNYIMTILEDLGRVPSPSNPDRYYRMAIFECPVCKTPFKARATGSMARAQTSCANCTGTHNLSKHPLYAIWNGIRQRCYNPKRKDYPRYGALGVTMHQDWIDNPTAFVNWCLSNGWSSELVVDKDIKSRQLGIEPAVYSPDTISFITTQENAKAATAKAVNQYTLEGELVATFESCTDAALSFGKPASAKSSIANCCRGTTHTAFGFKWSFITEGPIAE